TIVTQDSWECLSPSIISVARALLTTPPNPTKGLEDTMKLTPMILTGFGLATAIFVTSTALGDGRDPANYVGVKTCGICHKKDESGNQLAAWQASPHAKAFELLGTPAA